MYHKRRLLKRRGGVYYFRQRVPLALVPVLGGRVEVQRSLRTADHREALLRAAVVELGLARCWRAALAMRGDAMRSLDQREMERLAEEYYERLVAEDRAGRHGCRPTGQLPGCPDELDPAEFDFQMTVFQHWSVLQDERERMLEGDRRSVKEEVERVAAGRDFDEETRDRLGFALQRAYMRYLRAMAEELEADFSGRPRAVAGAQAANAAGQALAAAANTGASPSAKTITEAVEEWVHEEGREWKKKTLDETRRALRWLVQVVGDVRPDAVKREDMKRFKANLERVPRGTAATADIRTFAAKAPERALDRATVTKLLGRVVRFFSWTVDRQWVRISPAAGLLKKGKKRGREARELRESFTREELRSIFGADYAEHEHERPARYWVPLLLLYTGARRGEVAQLLVEDVQEVEGGVFVLDLNEDGDAKSLKTEASRRKVPVHSQVIELGFMEFVETRRRERALRLFPDVEQSANGWGDEVGKWFGRWRKKHGVTSRKKPLHAMRHTVKDALTRAGVATDVVKAVQGWEGEGSPYDWYGSAPRLEELRAAVERLDWQEPLKALFERRRGSGR